MLGKKINKIAITFNLAYIKNTLNHIEEEKRKFFRQKKFTKSLKTMWHLRAVREKHTEQEKCCEAETQCIS